MPARGLNIKTALLAQKPGGRDPRAKRTFYFFALKGFISNVPPGCAYRGRLSLTDVLWTCEHVAPALYELLPAVLLRFPKHLPGPVPPDLDEILKALRQNAKTGPRYHGHEYRLIRSWLGHPSKDRRVSKELCRLISVRLPVDLIDSLARLAKARDCTRTFLIISAIKACLPEPDGSDPVGFAGAKIWGGED